MIERQAHHDLGPLTVASAGRADRPAVKLDQTLGQRQADAEAVAGSLAGPGLHERLKDPRELRGRDPAARVTHADDRLVADRVQREPDLPARRRELRRVVEQVGDHLHQPDAIPLDRAPARTEPTPRAALPGDRSPPGRARARR